MAAACTARIVRLCVHHHLVEEVDRTRSLSSPANVKRIPLCVARELIAARLRTGGVPLGQMAREQKLSAPARTQACGLPVSAVTGLFCIKAII